MSEDANASPGPTWPHLTTPHLTAPGTTARTPAARDQLAPDQLSLLPTAPHPTGPGQAAPNPPAPNPSPPNPTAPGLIGPNAILQLLPVIDRFAGPEAVNRLLTRAGLPSIPDGHGMIPEDHAARLHRQLRRDAPDDAPRLSAEAGARTADYILAHRIPKPAQWLLKALPSGPSARLLSRAIAQHSWTFAGSGRFRVLDPWTFQIADNPLIRGEVSETCLCHWHAAVFARLYATLVSPRCTCIETACGSRSPDRLCRFEISR